ncbi:MAG: hypothetical protein K2Y01_00390 [Rhabdochlamydiaceae bacterium]|nr:hypothetical protein [Rhabdochlamydiaceae bacterium]
MPDNVNPIAAEFGEAEGAIPVMPVKPQKEIEPSDGFQREMEKKSKTVQSKDEDRQAQQDTRQLEREVRINKASVEEAEAARVSQNSILDVQKPSSDKTPSKEVNLLDPTQKVAKTSSATGADNDLSQGQDSFGQNLPTQVPASGKGKDEVDALGKATASAAPDTGEKKKIEVSTDMQSSSDNKDSSPQDKKFAVAAPEKQKQTEASSPGAKATETAVTSEPISKKIQATEQTASPKQAAHVATQTAKVENAHPSQDATLQVSQPEKKVAAPTSAQTAFGQTSQDQKHQEGSMHVDNVEPLSPEQTEKLTENTAHQFAVAPPTEIRKETWFSKDEQEKAAGHAKVEGADETQASDQQQKERDQQEEEKEKHAISQSSQNLLDQIFPDINGKAPPEAIGFDRLPAHVLDLFDRMVGVITVMQMQGKTETTLYLNEQQSPLFKGTAVVLTTYSTAPMAYNIEFKAPPEASVALQKHVNQLKTAFKDPKKEFNFQIHEIMVSLQEEESK